MSVEVPNDRLRLLLESVTAMAGGNFDTRVPISAERDEVDSISFGINILADEIQYLLAKESKRSEELAAALAQLEKTLSDLKTTHDLLIQSAKMAALGEFSAGLAHEINNPLAVIRAYVSQIESLSGEHSSIPSDSILVPIDRINSAIDRMVKTIKHVRDFSVPQSTACRLSLNDVVASALDFVRAQIEIKGIDLRVDLAKVEPFVQGNQAPLEQVILNMIANASDAIENKRAKAAGWIEVRTVCESEFNIFEIADNGAGIDPAIMSKIYLPFFTTKGPFGGTGIGLSMCLRILTSHHASIQCESKPGVGTRFIVHFPAIL